MRTLAQGTCCSPRLLGAAPSARSHTTPSVWTSSTLTSLHRHLSPWEGEIPMAEKFLECFDDHSGLFQPLLMGILPQSVREVFGKAKFFPNRTAVSIDFPGIRVSGFRVFREPGNPGSRVSNFVLLLTHEFSQAHRLVTMQNPLGLTGEFSLVFVRHDAHFQVAAKVHRSTCETPRQAARVARTPSLTAGTRDFLPIVRLCG